MDELSRRRHQRLMSPSHTRPQHCRAVETDHRGRVVLPERPHQRFYLHERADGSLLLVPARGWRATQSPTLPAS